MLSLVRDISVSVSYTTRPPRPGEANGVDYHFITESEFRSRALAGGFLESATVHGNEYGTGAEYRTEIEKGRDVLFEVDVQGAARLRAVFPDAVKVFLLPPSFAVLEARLRGRGSDREEVIERRLQNARRELMECRSFHYVLVNDDLEEAVQTFAGIIRAERVRVSRMEPAISRLLAQIKA
jgi:guanylate kinase